MTRTATGTDAAAQAAALTAACKSVPRTVPMEIEQTGVVVLASSHRIVYMNEAAAMLIARMGEKRSATPLPEEMVELCREVRLYGTAHALIPAEVSTRSACWIGAHGLVIPITPVRVLLLLKESAPVFRPSFEERAARFHLTPREKAVVRHLAWGATNKDIAQALGIAEQTVKEHMKHLMMKLGATTRTGLLATFLAADPMAVPPGERLAG